MQSLAEMVDTFDNHNINERTIFDAAMKKRIEDSGYRMADLLFEVYQSQKEIAQLRFRMTIQDDVLSMLLDYIQMEMEDEKPLQENHIANPGKKVKAKAKTKKVQKKAKPVKKAAKKKIQISKKVFL